MIAPLPDPLTAPYVAGTPPVPLAATLAVHRAAAEGRAVTLA